MAPFPIQPQPIKIPEEDPFQYDLLDRKEAVETLTRLVSTIEGPCVLAMDAPWGAGKTTFLKIWAQYLRNQQFPVVEFNAWKTDFSDDPFMALCAELTRGFGEGEGDEYAKEFKKAAQTVFQLVSMGVSYHTGGAINIQQMWSAIKGIFTKPQRFADYQKTNDAFKDFEKKLKKLASALVDKKGRGPLVVMIDELDRCRPSYAVELLETAKHLFDVDQIVFVLAVNREQLGHAVRALYGADFNAEGYLRRFFDIDFRLPESEREHYIDVLLDSTDIEDEVVRNILLTFLDASLLSLRDIAQAVHRIGLVLNSLSGNREAMEHLISIALILRTLNETLYHQFFRGDVTDAEVAKEIFGIPSISLRQYETDGFMFQIGLARAYRELSALPLGRRTPLETEIERHLERMEDNEERRLIEKHRKYINELLEDNDATATDFRDAYGHIELFSSDSFNDTGLPSKQSMHK